LTRCRCPTLRAVPSKSRETPYKLSDNGGPYLLVEKNGSKLWRHAYRFDGRQKLIALNREARFERAEALGRSAYKIVYALKIEGVIDLEGDRLPAHGTTADDARELDHRLRSAVRAVAHVFGEHAVRKLAELVLGQRPIEHHHRHLDLERRIEHPASDPASARIGPCGD
jgi:hypothetical protein